MGNELSSIKNFTIHPKFEWETRVPTKADSKGLHFPPGTRVRDWREYQVTKEHTPELYELQERLAARGLKDPWARNWVWMLDRRVWGQPYQRRLFFMRGAGVATVLVAVHYVLRHILFPKKEEPFVDKYPIVNEALLESQHHDHHHH